MVPPDGHHYPILRLPDDVETEAEVVGSQRKFWFDSNGRQGLFKQRTREAHPSGEDWAEKIAAELAR